MREMAKMTDEFSSRQVLVMPPAPNAPELSRYEQMIAAAPITADPPIHTWTRRMLLPAFAPKAVTKWQDYTEELCHELIDGFIEAGAVRRRRRLQPADPAAGDRPHDRRRPRHGRPVRRSG